MRAIDSVGNAFFEAGSQKFVRGIGQSQFINIRMPAKIMRSPIIIGSTQHNSMLVIHAGTPPMCLRPNSMATQMPKTMTIKPQKIDQPLGLCLLILIPGCQFTGSVDTDIII